jgi:hypothetical protein
VTSRTTYRRAPIPIPHHMRSPLLEFVFPVVSSVPGL